MFKYLNRDISFPIAIGIIFFSVIIISGGIFVYQYHYIPQKEVQNLIIEVPKRGISRNETAGWQVFRDDEVGYSLKYPPELKASDFLVFNITKEKIDNITDEFPYFIPGYTKEIILQDEENLKNEHFGYSPPFSLKQSQKLVKIDNKIWGKEFTTLSEFEVCCVLPTRTLIFFKDGYIVNIVLQVFAVDKIISELPQYFESDPKNCGNTLIWKDQNQFYSDLVNGVIDSETEAGIWYNTFDKIISTIELFDISSSEGGNVNNFKIYRKIYRDESRDEKYGFEIRYPEGTKITEQTEWQNRYKEISFILPFTEGTRLMNKELKVLIEDTYSPDYCLGLLAWRGPTNVKEININGTKFYYVPESGWDYDMNEKKFFAKDYVAFRNKKCFILKFRIDIASPIEFTDSSIAVPPFPPEKDLDTSIFDEILSSFKFLKSLDNKISENEEISFREPLIYPLFSIKWQEGEDYSEHVSTKKAEFIVKGENSWKKVLEWPVIKNISDPRIIRKIDEILNFDRYVRFTKYDATDAHGITDVYFDVNYDKDNILSLTFHICSYGAYPDSYSFNKNINLKTGELITIEDLTSKSKSDILILLNQKLQTEKDNLKSDESFNKLLKENSYLQETVYKAKFREKSLNDFKITEKGIEYDYYFGFPHAFQVFDQISLILTWDELK